MAADDIARGALRLINWGKEIAPTADELKVFGPKAARVGAIIRMLPGMSDDAKIITSGARHVTEIPNALGFKNIGDVELAALRQMDRQLVGENVATAAFDAGVDSVATPLRLSMDETENFAGAAESAAIAEAARDRIGKDIFVADLYKPLTSALATGRRFDRTVPTAPESFTAIARSLGEMGQITSPKGVEAARRLSMEDPTFTQLVMSFVQDGMSLEDALAAARALGL
jgi:hypothetical protein